MTTKIPVLPSLANLDLSTSPSPAPNTLLLSQTLPPETRKALLAHLSTTSAIGPLSDLLTTTLHQQPPISSSSSRPAATAADWPSRVYALALELLRSGACAPNFQDVMREVTRRALLVEEEGGQGEEGGVGGEEERERIATIVLPSGSYGRDGLPDVRVSGKVVDVAVRFLEKRVRGVVEVVEREEGED